MSAADIVPRRRPSDRLKWLIDRGHILPESLEVGTHMLKLAEQKQRDTMTISHFNTDGGGGGGGHPGIARIAARRKWEQMMGLVGPEAEAILTCVIVEGKSLGEAAKELGIHDKAILPVLRLALYVLARS